jgi:hypothetical protein
MDYEQGNIIERVLWYEADLLARCRDTVNRTRQLREIAARARARRMGRWARGPGRRDDGLHLDARA